MEIPHLTMTFIIPAALLLLISIICLINIINPRYLWQIFQSWKAVKEPTEAYFKARRISGIVGLIITMAGLLVLTIVYLYLLNS